MTRKQLKKRESRVVHKKGDVCKLSELKKGQTCKVLSMTNDNKALRRRLLDMGITKGVLIHIKKLSPLGDPIDIELRDYELCIRKADMEEIEVEVVD
ncbi:MAG: ferrous iron transport protein A [Coprobacillus sp.]|nr:ferrous iron transport protein A [Coprobacillus sp.]